MNISTSLRADSVQKSFNCIIDAAGPWSPSADFDCSSGFDVESSLAIQHGCNLPTAFGFSCLTSKVASSKRMKSVPVDPDMADSVATGNRPAKRARRGAMASKACHRCRTMKLKCDAARPCVCCIKRGCAGSCADWDKAEFVNSDDGQDQSSAKAEADPGKTYVDVETILMCSPPDFMHLLLSKMFSLERVSNWINGFTDELRDSMVDFMKLSLLASPELRTYIEMKIQPSTDMILVEENVGTEPQPDVAYMRYSLADNRCSVNMEYCRMMATPREEIPAKLQEHDLYHMLSDLDALAMLLDMMHAAMRAVPDNTHAIQRCCVLSRTWGKKPGTEATPVLVHLTLKFTYDSAGVVQTVEQFFRQIPVDEFDTAKLAYPALCRPFAAIAGDTRSGRELLDEYEFERRCAPAELRGLGCFQTRMQAATAYFHQSSAKLVARMAAGDDGLKSTILQRLHCPEMLLRLPEIDGDLAQQCSPPSNPSGLHATCSGANVENDTVAFTPSAPCKTVAVHTPSSPMCELAAWEASAASTAVPSPEEVRCSSSCGDHPDSEAFEHIEVCPDEDSSTSASGLDANAAHHPHHVCSDIERDPQPRAETPSQSEQMLPAPVASTFKFVEELVDEHCEVSISSSCGGGHWQGLDCWNSTCCSSSLGAELFAEHSIGVEASDFLDGLWGGSY